MTRLTLLANAYALFPSWSARNHGLVPLYALIFLLGTSAPMPGFAAKQIVITTLSSRPDMVTGDDALVQVAGSDDILWRKLSVWLEGREVTAAFHASPLTHAWIGLVDGLTLGKNRLEVRAGRKVLGRLELTNHAITGPIFSGPHQTPFICQTGSAGLGAPLDSDCSVKTEVTYLYKSTQPPPMADPAAAMKAGAPPAEFKLYDRSARRPDDIAEATTREGKKVKYIVRWERGTINRAIYEIAFLHEPGTPLPDAWTITVGWNGRLVFIFGGGIKAGFHQGNPFSAVDDLFLSRGYAVATSSLNVFGNNCDDVISAETMEMVKEHFIKRFGIPVHTIGWGASGGSMQQHLIAQNYPGLLDGIIVMNSFPDITSVVPGVVDCSLLAHAFDAAKQPWTDEQKTSVSGFVSWGTCAKESKGSSWIKRHYSPNLVQPIACNAVIQPGLVYAPGSNPKGARCDIYDNEITVYGRDPKTGFARRPLDNIGVQYGLLAFNSGKISAEQFLELNEKIGGYDHDGNIVPARMAADPEALHIAYATGRVNTGSGGLRSIPIIDLRTYEDSLPDIHDELRSFVTRARLMAANGRADNHVMFTVPFAVPGKKLSPLTHEQLKASLTFMDQWLGNILKDNSPHSTIEKIVSGKPAQLVDTCWTEEGEKIAEKRTYDGNGRCNQLYPPHAEPRMAAGEPLTDDVLKCTLKPIDPKDYLHPLREEQLTRLKAVFPQGVCDFSRPGTGQVSVQGAWRKY